MAFRWFFKDEDMICRHNRKQFYGISTHYESFCAGLYRGHLEESGYFINTVYERTRDNFPCHLLSEMNCMTAQDAPYLARAINYGVLTAKIIRISGQESCLVNKILAEIKRGLGPHRIYFVEMQSNRSRDTFCKQTFIRTSHRFISRVEINLPAPHVGPVIFGLRLLY